MERSKSASSQCCVTCAFWGGKRQTTTYRDRAEYDGNDDKGECLGGGWNRSMKTAGFTCSSWSKWAVLK